MGDAILRIPRDARVRAYRTRDTYDGVVPVTSKRQPYCLSIYIELSALCSCIVPVQEVVSSSGSRWRVRKEAAIINDRHTWINAATALEVYSSYCTYLCTAGSVDALCGCIDAGHCYVALRDVFL